MTRDPTGDRPPGGGPRPPDRALAVARCCTAPPTPSSVSTGRYDAVDVSEAGLADFVALAAARSGSGLSLTMPLKHAVLPLLDETDDTVDARRRGEHPGLAGRSAGRRQHRRLRPGGRAAREPVSKDAARAAVLGAGATAASALVALARSWAATTGRAGGPPARGHRTRWSTLAGSAGSRARGGRLGDGRIGARRAAGASPPSRPAVADASSARVPRSPGVLFDVVYAPWPTPLAAGLAARRWAGSERSRPARPPSRRAGRADDRARGRRECPSASSRGLTYAWTSWP